tara:strand:- start:175 stop:567 length:393 start_codon:yes stop_codon:yes gene_type:complete
MAKTLENTSIDDLVSFIEDGSKNIKKSKKKTTVSTIDKEADKQLKKMRKEKLSKYNRDKHPLYGKKRTEQELVREEYKKMLQNEDLMKQEKMKEIMKVMNNTEISEEQKKEFFGSLLNAGEIEMNDNKTE